VVISVHIPTRIRASPGGLAEHSAAAIADALAAAAERALVRSGGAVLVKAGGGAKVRFNEPVLRWTGDQVGQVEPATRGAIEQAVLAALTRAISRAGLSVPRRTEAALVVDEVGETFDPARFDPVENTYAIPSYHPAPAAEAGRKRPLPLQPPKEAQAWKVRTEATFRVKPGVYFDIGDRIGNPPKPRDEDLRSLNAEVLDTTRSGTAQIIEVLRETDVRVLMDDVIRKFVATRSNAEVIHSIYGWRGLRNLIVKADEGGTIAGKIPEFDLTGFSEARPATATTGEQMVVRPGAWILLLLLVLPAVRLDNVVKLGKHVDKDLKLLDVGGLIPPDAFAAELKLSWAEAETSAPDSNVAVLADAFVVGRKVQQRTLDVLLARRREEVAPGSGMGRLGRAMPLTDDGLTGLRPPLRQLLEPLRSGKLLAPADDGTWAPGTQGVSVGASFDAELELLVLAGRNAAFLKAEADRVAQILALKDSTWSYDRSDAVEVFVDRWKDRDARLFGLLLAELERRGLLDGFIDAVRALPQSWNTARRRYILALAARTKYANNPRIVAMQQQVEAAGASIEKFRYDIAAQTIWIDGLETKTLHAAGSSADDRAGVVAEVEPYYSESARVMQPGPELLKQLAEPTRKKVGELMARMICGEGETMSREQLLQKAVQEAAKELKPPPEEKDFVKVTLQQSIRVLKLEPRLELGVHEVYVTFQEVRRFGTGPWESFGEVGELEAYAFEQRLKVYHVRHLQAALLTFALAELVLLGGVLVVEVFAIGIGTLLLFVGIQVALYWWNTDKEDRTLDGYLLAALRGELDTVGFKLISGAAKGVAQAFAGRLLARELISEVGTKWVIFTLRGTVTATGFGAAEVVHQFAADLLTYGKCKGFPSPSTYWDKFKDGFLMGLLMEFIVIPFLSPPLRAALERATDALQAARVLRATGKSVREIAGVLLQGTEKVEAALGRTISRAEVLPPMTRGFRARIGQVLSALAREYESRAYAAILDLYGPELGAEARLGLRRLLGAASEREIDGLLQRLLSRKVPVGDLLGVLGSMDEAAVVQLAGTGQIERLAVSPRVMAWITRAPRQASYVLTGSPFKLSVDRLEAYLGRLESLTLEARESVLGAIASAHPLSPDQLLAAAKALGTLDEPTLKLLRQLVEAKVQVDLLFNGPGIPLKPFLERFAKIPPNQQALALQIGKAHPQPPGRFLTIAENAQRELKAVAEAIDPTPEAVSKQLAEGTRGKARDLVIGKLRTGIYQNAVLGSALSRQARKLAVLRADIRAFSPEAIVGAERGGPFIAEQVAAGEPQLGSRILSIPKPQPNKRDVQFADMKARVEALIAEGKKRFAFVDVIFSQSAVNQLNNEVIEPLARVHSDCEFRGFFLREALGYELRVSPTDSQILPSPGGHWNILNKAYDVPFVVGEDAEALLNATGHDPIFVFDSEGRIVEILEPKPGETTRQMLVRILSERGGQ
jgi:hypothetical protein